TSRCGSLSTGLLFDQERSGCRACGLWMTWRNPRSEPLPEPRGNPQVPTGSGPGEGLSRSGAELPTGEGSSSWADPQVIRPVIPRRHQDADLTVWTSSVTWS